MAVKKTKEFMSRAIGLAAKANNRTLPNPMVGAVLVKNGRIVGEGYHKGPGNPHAEIIAITKAGKKSAGATLYVNLEPCCHTGRTGPCTDAIISAGIRKVVYAAIDPNPNVNGKGARILKNAGVEVSNALLSEEATRLNEIYLGTIKTGRSYVTVKLAQSLDGRIATSAGDSKWISSEESRKFVHQLRAESQAVLVGMETVRKDNPELTTRLVNGDNPYRIIVGDGAKLSRKLKLVSQNGDFKTIVATSDKISSGNSKNLIYWSLKKNRAGQVDLNDLINKAKDFGIHSILVEGGARIATSLLKAKLVDKLILVTAPIILGAGVDTIGDLGIRKVTNAVKFKEFHKINCGSDEMFIGYPDWGKK